MLAPRYLTLAAVICTAIVAALSIGAGPVSAGGGCHEPPSDARGNRVDMRGNCMLPTVLRVDAGATVEFLNHDRQPHTVTGAGARSAEGWGDFEEIAYDASVAQAFAEDGTYVYYCVFHPGMVGAIVVGDGEGASALGASVSRVGGAGSAPDRADEHGRAAETDESTDDKSRRTLLIWLGGAVITLAVVGVIVTRRRGSLLSR
jgi:plastocyanin